MGSWAKYKTCYQNNLHADVSCWRLTGPGLGAHGESDLSHSYFFVLLLSVLTQGLIKLCRLDLELIVIQVGIEFNLPASASGAAIMVWTTMSFLR